MKTSVALLATILVGTAAIAPSAISAEVYTTAQVVHGTTVSGIKPVSLEEIKELSRKDVSAGIIIKLLQNNAAVYTLSANDIVDLQAAQVKPEVIEYLLSTHQSQTSQQPAGAAPTAASATHEPVIATTQSAVTAPVVPTQPEVQTVYVPSYSYSYGYPYYYRPYSYYWPSVSFNFGYGYYGFGHHGYSHGYNHYGGGYHGGGHYSGHYGGGHYGGHGGHYGGGHGGHH
jgi:hypothetical protein